MGFTQVLTFCLLLIGASAFGEAKVSRVLMVINDGYRPEEYFIPRKIFLKTRGF